MVAGSWQDEGLHEFALLERLLGMLNNHFAAFSLRGTILLLPFLQPKWLITENFRVV